MVDFEYIVIYLFICSAGYSFFDSGEVALLGRKKNSPFADIGMFIFFSFRNDAQFSPFYRRKSYTSRRVLIQPRGRKKAE